MPEMDFVINFWSSTSTPRCVYPCPAARACLAKTNDWPTEWGNWIGSEDIKMRIHWWVNDSFQRPHSTLKQY